MLPVDVGRVVGQVVATAKQRGLQGRSLLVVAPVDLDDVDGGVRGELTYVAADHLGAGNGEVVLVSRGGAARVEDGTGAVPTDAAIVAIVDTVVMDGRTVFRKSG